MVKKSDDIYA